VGDIGKVLREARESRGLDFHEVEEATHIRTTFLQALEEERFQELPGHVYGRGLLRNYARYLGLDEEPLIRAYDALNSHAPTPIPQVLDEPLLTSRYRPIRRFLLAILGLALLALIGWYLFNYLYLGQLLWPLDKLLTVAPAAADVTKAPATLWPVPTVIPTNPQQATALPVQTVCTATPKLVVPPSPTPEPTDRLTPTTVPTITPSPTVYAEALAKADCYLEVRVDGEKVYEGILAADQTLSWTAAQTLTLRIGNAGGLALKVNDVDLGVLGAPAEVIDLEFTPDTLPES